MKEKPAFFVLLHKRFMFVYVRALNAEVSGESSRRKTVLLFVLSLSCLFHEGSLFITLLMFFPEAVFCLLLFHCVPQFLFFCFTTADLVTIYKHCERSVMNTLIIES